MSYRCPICGNTNPIYIGYFKNTPYCRRCLKFIAKQEVENITFNNETVLNLNYELTQKQVAISNQIINNFKVRKNTLIHAVCGAGKTELTFKLIEYCLKNNLKVGFSIPRKDVVIELYNRLKDVFINSKVICLHGGNTNDLEGELTVLTTHQLYRYKKYFDLLILDEIDAFPFKNNQVLHSFLNRSLKGNLLLMTATISDYEKEKFRNNKFEIIELYQRFHGYKMPVPKIVLKTGIFKLLYLLKKVKEFVDNKKPLLIFVGYIKDSINLFTFINIFVKGGAYLNSKVEKRENIINEFKRGELKYIVTTSVLERGVTLSNLQVIVYDSYKNVFDSQTLIQISGRVGRKKEFPNGEIIFLSYKKTKDMENAIKTIIEENNIRE